METSIYFIIACISAVYCIPPRYNPSYTQVSVQRSVEVPFRENRRAAFTRLSRQQQPPQPSASPSDMYGPPSDTYGPPSDTYGPPADKYGPPTPPPNTTETTTDYPTTTEQYSESVNSTNPRTRGTGTRNKLQGVEEQVYYVYHPSGVLQRVVFAGKDDAKNMRYNARIRYENVEPIREPVYTYDPQTLAWMRLQLRR